MVLGTTLFTSYEKWLPRDVVPQEISFEFQSGFAAIPPLWVEQQVGVFLFVFICEHLMERTRSGLNLALGNLIFISNAVRIFLQIQFLCLNRPLTTNTKSSRASRVYWNKNWNSHAESDWHLISPHIVPLSEALFIHKNKGNDHRIKNRMIVKQILLSVLRRMYGEQYGEYTYWYKDVKD